MDFYDMVRENHRLMHSPVGEESEPTPASIKKGAELLREEHNELMAEFAKLRGRMLSSLAPKIGVEDLADLVHEVADALFVGYGFLVRLGLRPGKHFSLAQVTEPNVIVVHKGKERALWQIQTALSHVGAQGDIIIRAYSAQAGLVQQGGKFDKTLLSLVVSAYIDKLFDLCAIMSIDIRPIFEAVTEANNDKLDENGQPIIVDGKYRKPLGWVPADADILRHLKVQAANGD